MLTNEINALVLTLSRLRAAERAIIAGDKGLAIELITIVYDRQEQQYYAKACVERFQDIHVPQSTTYSPIK